MARRKNTPIIVPLLKHGCLWWICIGWWWRPCLYVFWLFVNVILNVRIEFVKQR